jgi:hypothetical protein
MVIAVSLAVAILTAATGQRSAVQRETPAPAVIAAQAEPTTPGVTIHASTSVPFAAEQTQLEQSGSQLVAFEGSDAPGLAQPPALPTGLDVPLVDTPVDGPLLPTYRIVTYYGHPHDANMGIVGEHAMDDLAALLRTEAANYAAADPSRPVIAAFELIATVAQGVPGNDGSYVLDTDHETLRGYIDYAAEHGMLVVLDLQIGRSTVAAEIEKVRDLLARPNVHLALDPEFAVAEGEIPGQHIGAITADAVAYAQQVLAEVAATNGVPPKILIVHQFREDMIVGKTSLAPYPGVQLVIDADGYGGPELKTAVYNFLVRDEPVEFAGVKVFYRQDVPVMSAQDLLALVPAPDVIIYQ